MENPRVQQFLAVESQKVQTRAHIELITEKCWEKCIDQPSNQLGSRTEKCLRDCVNRYVDSSNYVTNRLKLNAEKFAQTPEPFS